MSIPMNDPVHASGNAIPRMLPLFPFPFPNHQSSIINHQSSKIPPSIVV